MAQQPTLPEYKASVQVEPVSSPDYQHAAQKFGEDTNILSDIGAKVVQVSSSAMAKQMGYEQGNTPKGDLLPPITEFDRQYKQAYESQAAATLNVQANQLFNDVQQSLAQAQRLTPELLSNANDQVAQGIESILKNAPQSIRPHMQETLYAQMLSQNTKYQNKMVSEQREDQKNIQIKSIQDSTDAIYEMAIGGDENNAFLKLDEVKFTSQALKDGRFITPQMEETLNKTAKQTLLNGTWIGKYLEQKSNGKGEKFLADMVDKKPQGVSNKEWLGALKSVYSYAENLNKLKKEQQNVDYNQFLESVAKDPHGISDVQIQNFHDSVDEATAAKGMRQYWKAMNKKNSHGAEVQKIVDNPTDATVVGRANPSALNDAFDQMVDDKIMAADKLGHSLDIGQAKIEVAAAMPKAVPRFVSELNTRGETANPDDLEFVSKAFDYLHQHGNGQVLEGLQNNARAVSQNYSIFSRAHPREEAAQMAHDSIYAIDQKKMDKMVKDWDVIDKNIKKGGENSFYLKLADVAPSWFTSGAQIMNPQAFTQNAKDSLKAYYYLTGGNMSSAQNMLKQDLAQSYGETKVNTIPNEFAYQPLEKTVGLPADSSAVSIIQDDIRKQLEEQIAPIKDSYSNETGAYFFEMVPKGSEKPEPTIAELSKGTDPQRLILKMLSDDIIPNLPSTEMKRLTDSPIAKLLPEGMVPHTPEPIYIRQIYKNGTVKKFQVIVQANPWNREVADATHPYTGGWDISLLSEDGGIQQFPLDHAALRYPQYNPDIASIQETYQKKNPHKFLLQGKK